jgi:flagellar biosynthesis protein FliQ
MMESDKFIDAAQHALWVLAMGATPLLIPMLVTGVLLGMVQAATSINETTLSFVPKLIVFGVCLALFGGTIMALMVDLTQDMFDRIPEMVR